MSLDWIMNNEAYRKALDGIISSLVKLRSEGVDIAKGIVGETLMKEDLFYCASLDRCLSLIDGIILLLRERNLTCAGAILRLQMDNCMRTYAAFIAEDREKVVNCLIYGTPIKNERDINGNKMNDGYLKEVITKIDSRFARVFDQASGYVHLSEKAFYQTITDIDNDGKLTVRVGHDLPEKRNEPLLECAEAFCHFVRLHFKMLAAVVDNKKRIDAECQENNKEDDSRVKS